MSFYEVRRLWPGLADFAVEEAIFAREALVIFIVLLEEVGDAEG